MVDSYVYIFVGVFILSLFFLTYVSITNNIPVSQAPPPAAAAAAAVKKIHLLIISTLHFFHFYFKTSDHFRQGTFCLHFFHGNTFFMATSKLF